MGEYIDAGRRAAIVRRTDNEFNRDVRQEYS